MTRAPSRWLGAAVLGAAVLAVAGAAAFWAASQRRPETTADQLVTVDAAACRPNQITVPGGRRSFQIVNDGDRPIEWEILSGVMVVAERENIAPGFSATLEVALSPGRYEMTCGLLSNPRGTLTVTASDEASAAASEVTLRKFLGPLSEYRVYLAMQGNAAVKAAQALRDAIARDDLDGARAAWEAARLPYRRVEPLAYLLSDLENAIDPRAAYLAGREGDPGFTGFHRIEYGLWDQGSTAGLAPVAERLVADLGTLAARLRETPPDPALLTALPGAMARQIAQAHLPQGENAYAGTDAAELAASLDGIGKLTALLSPVVAGVDPALDARIAADLQRARDDVAALQARPWSEVTDDQRQALVQDFTRLADTLDRLAPVIGMN
ncbi:iron transporter substrate-binding protein [Paracoccus yeei]|uniref:Iron transporter substrate-binding protein n=1 Tax=Paracoccus yeei TaxID=147645 RepID=A0A386UMS1_9RHOB|nr:iron uptake system protein EfeO [Paracoccus yeei]AYF01776.1 iron transporter substrate-binding protein [Paracoccus yeei]